MSPSSSSAAGSLAEAGLRAFPPVAVALLHLHGREDVQLSEVTELVGSDPPATAQVMRAANSVFPGVRGQTTELNQAAVVLGLRTSISIATASTLSAGPDGALPLLRGCWRHSLATALIAEMLAPAIDVSPLRAHSVGLLHDIGRVTLAFCDRNGHAELWGNAPRYAGDANGLGDEQERFGASHAAVGEAVLQRLELPEVFQRAARHHHAPIDVGSAASILTLTQIACRAARAAGFGLFEQVQPRAGTPEVDPGRVPPNLPDRVRDAVGTVVKLMEAYELAL
jgi:putative nucleotidyltransferase with HDIG domain